MTTESPVTVDLEALERLAKEAAPSPWESQRTEDADANALVYGPDGDSFAYLSWNPGNDYDMPATAAFIAAASPDTILALIAENRRLARLGELDVERLTEIRAHIDQAFEWHRQGARPTGQSVELTLALAALDSLIVHAAALQESHDA